MKVNNKTMELAPIILFAYRRLEHLKKTIETLSKNKFARESRLFIFSDGPRNKKDQPEVNEVRKYLKTIKGFKEIEIIEREKNYGLSNSIIDGVTKVINDFGKVIVLEDDLVTSSYFLKFMNEGLEIYEKEKGVGAICAYIHGGKNLPETFFLKFFSSWGWGTWQDRWLWFEPDAGKLLKEIKSKNLQKEFDLDNSYFFSQLLKMQSFKLVDSWAIRWYGTLFLRNKLCLFPKKSLIKNIGFGKRAFHTKTFLGSKLFSQELIKREIKVEKLIPIRENLKAKTSIVKHFKRIDNFLLVRLMKARNYFKLLKAKYGSKNTL